MKSIEKTALTLLQKTKPKTDIEATVVKAKPEKKLLVFYHLPDCRWNFFPRKEVEEKSERAGKQ